MAQVPTAPKLLVNGAPAGELTRDLESLCVHVARGHADAEVVVVGPVPDALSGGAAGEHTTLAIRLTAHEECFTGHVGEIETRMLPDFSHRTVLFAAGTSLDGSELPTVPLRFGAEVESGSVRRGAQNSTTHFVSTTPTLRWNSRVSVATPDPTFDGQFRVSELWYRFDVTRGLEVEVIGVSG